MNQPLEPRRTLQGMSRSQTRRVAESQVEVSLTALAIDPIWGEGLALGDHTSALGKRLIDVNSSHAEVDRQFQCLFGSGVVLGDPVAAAPVPPAHHKCRQVCHATCGGLCQREARILRVLVAS